jgi:hypothetical protein
VNGGSAMRRLFVCWWASEMVFWLLALAAQLPVAGALWLSSRLLNLSDTFRAFIVELIRWRKAG